MPIDTVIGVGLLPIVELAPQLEPMPIDLVRRRLNFSYRRTRVRISVQPSACDKRSKVDGRFRHVKTAQASGKRTSGVKIGTSELYCLSALLACWSVYVTPVYSQLVALEPWWLASHEEVGVLILQNGKWKKTD